jgi:hypothetical protein
MSGRNDAAAMRIMDFLRACPVGNYSSFGTANPKPTWRNTLGTVWTVIVSLDPPWHRRHARTDGPGRCPPSQGADNEWRIALDKLGRPAEDDG